jgi:hypothetical protein
MAGVCLGIVAVLAACGEGDTTVTSEPETDRLAGTIDLGLREQRIVAGESSYLVLGGTGEGTAAAHLVVVDGGTPKVSQEWELGRWEPGLRMDAREADDGSWLIGVETCADGTSAQAECADDAVAVYQGSPGDKVSALAVLGSVTGTNFAVAGGTGDYLALESGASEPTDPSQFVRVDLQSGELRAIETRVEASPSVRTGCVTGDRLAVLDGFVRPVPTATVTFLKLDDPTDPQVVDVALPPGESPYWMVCEPGGAATVVTTDQERRQLSTVQVATDGSVAPPEQVTLPAAFQDAQFGPGTVAVVVAADLTPEEGAKAVEEGRIPEREAQLVVYRTDGGWSQDPLQVSADDSVRATTDGRSLLVSRRGSTTVRVVPR